MSRDGFNLIELLVVVTIVALLAGMLMPVVAMVREAALGQTCLNHQRQILLAAMIYAEDNDGLVIPPAVPRVPGPGNQLWHGKLNDLVVGQMNATLSNKGRNIFWGCPTWKGRMVAPGVQDMVSVGIGATNYPLCSGSLAGQEGLPLYNSTSKTNNPVMLASVTFASNRLWFADAGDFWIWSDPAAQGGPQVRLDNWTWAGGVRHRNGMNIGFFDGRAGKVLIARAGDTFYRPHQSQP